MTTAITIGVRFSNGQIAYLSNVDVATGSVGEEIQTANAGGDLAQVSGVSIGQAYTGLVATHAFATCETQNALTGRLLHAYFLGPNGAILVPIQGGGLYNAQMMPLYKPIVMTTGVKAWGAWQATSDSATLICSVSICSPTKCDVFVAVAADGDNTELLSIQTSSTVGQSMDNLTAQVMWAVYPSTHGLNENGGGVSSVFMTASDGALKALIPASQGTGWSVPHMVQYPVRILQNDGLFVNTDT
mgnify:FL=1|tara:strand:- start:309 stop:1040 length:732 start_codon:yes stop_codon:yes gene_type:complete